MTNFGHIPRVLTISLLLTCAFISRADTAGALSAGYDRIRALESEEMLRRGEKWLNTPGRADSALLYFSALTARYSSDMSLTDKEICVRGAIGKWIVYFSWLFDYPKAYASLQEALEICEANGIDKSRVEVSMAGMLQMMAEQNGSGELYAQAADLYVQAISHAIETGLFNEADKAFVNLLILQTQDKSSKAMEIWPLYASIPCDSSNYRRSLAHVFQHALTVPEHQGHQMLVDAVSSLPDHPEYYRLHYIALLAGARLLQKADDLQGALASAKEARDFASANKVIDGELEATQLLADLHRALGHDQEANEEQIAYLKLKDSMLGNRQIWQLGELRFLANLRKAEKEMLLMETTHRKQKVIILLLSLLIVSIGALLWVFFSKSYRLRKANDLLYRQLRDSLAAEDQARTNPGHNNLVIDDSVKHRIRTAIEDIMSRPEVFCDKDFSINRLADMVKYNSKYVSRTISECFGSNFNTFVNRYRIREASRRMSPGGGWENFTIEAVSANVGFKSRSSFTEAFKQQTGLTPSEFRQRAAANVMK